MSILNKESKVEDFFIEREGDLYKDSKWDPSYYDPKHLNKEDNEVILTYKQREGSGRCDSFIVRDNGVGLGGSRLEGALTSVGYSTKRNRVDALGSFGLGSKVGLATGADYYKVTTVYNGVKYICQVYNRKLVSLIPEYNLDKDCENEILTFSTGDVIYGEKTDELNYCEIEVPCMKHHKNEYEYAVKTQLMYFPNIRFFVEREDESRYEIEFGANILHNSENIIISSNSPYTKPHVVIVKGGTKGSDTGVCYGELEFHELELEEMRGAVGVKCPIRQVVIHEDGAETLINDGVDVTSSRESVRWTANTKNFIKKQFEVAQNEATNIVEKELQQEDFTEWLKACVNIHSFANNRNSALYHLSKIVNISSLKPKYPYSKVPIMYQSFSSFFSTFTVTKVSRSSIRKEDKVVSERVDVTSWGEVDLSKIVFMNPDSRFNRVVDLYISYLNGGKAIVFKPLNDTDTRDLARKLNVKVDEIREEQKELIRLLNIPEERNYDSFIPTDEFIKSLEKGEEEAVLIEKEPTPEEIRKRENRTVCHTLVPRYHAYYSSDGETYKMDKQEPKIGEVADYKGKLFYGKMSDLPQLQFAAHILDRTLQNTVQGNRFWNSDYKLVVVAESNTKHFKMHNKVEDLFRKFVPVEDENKKIVGVNIDIDMNIVNWYTAKKVHDELKDKLDFLKNFSNFNQEISDDYKELCKYYNTHYVDITAYHNRVGMKEFYSPFLDFMSKVEKLQETVETETDKSLIADKVAELALPVGVTSGIAVDREILNKLNKVLDYANPIKALLNQVTILSREGYEIPTEVGMQIKEFLELKQR